MRKKLAGLTVLAAMLLTVTAWAKPAPFPGIFRNARYVYVTKLRRLAMEPEHSPRGTALPSEKSRTPFALGAISQSYKNRVMPEMILVVQRRGSEDELAVFDPTRGHDSTYLWRVMARGGLDKTKCPLPGISPGLREFASSGKREEVTRRL